jgi:beta-ribofuranosylaminobenzene 5'-phosphate synthase
MEAPGNPFERPEVCRSMASIASLAIEVRRWCNRTGYAGLEFVGMSSVGPSIAVITDLPEEKVGAILEKAGLRVAIATTVDNEGLKVHLEERA